MTKNKLGLSIIVLTHNNEKHISNCLKSLFKSVKILKIKSEVVIIDNNSKDQTVKFIKKVDGIKKIILKENIGFARGVNKGIQISNYNLILILNPDVILKKNSIREIIKSHSITGSDITGGLCLQPDNKVHGSFVRKPDIFTIIFDYTNLRKLVVGDIFHAKHYYHDIGVPRTDLEVDVVSGAYMLVKRKVFETIGLFDENFFMYLEDVDFCVRAKKNGFKISLCPKSKIIHIGGGSSNNRDKINYKAWINSRSYYTRKHFNPIFNVIAQPILLVDDIVSKIWKEIR